MNSKFSYQTAQVISPVSIQDAESASKCLAEANCSNLFLDGRKLEAMLAVTKDDVNKQIEERKNKPNKDNRNLFLAREGCKHLIELQGILFP